MFTGDFVNNVATEMNSFLPLLTKLTAKMGKYSILGNHDYGEYVPWKSPEEKNKNLNELIQLQKDLGFKLLLNEADRITLNGEEIEVLGIENWGLPSLSSVW